MSVRNGVLVGLYWIAALAFALGTSGIYRKSVGQVAPAVLVFVILTVVLPAAVLALVPTARQVVRDNQKWVAMLSMAYWGVMFMGLIGTLNRGTPFVGPWYAYPIFAAFGLTIGYFVWRLQESSKPPEPRW